MSVRSNTKLRNTKKQPKNRAQLWQTHHSGLWGGSGVPSLAMWKSCRKTMHLWSVRGPHRQKSMCFFCGKIKLEKRKTTFGAYCMWNFKVSIRHLIYSLSNYSPSFAGSEPFVSISNQVKRLEINESSDDAKSHRFGFVSRTTVKTFMHTSRILNCIITENVGRLW